MSRTEQRQRGGTAFAHLYGTARWQRVRARQLASEPLCAYCDRRGKVTAATVCDHVNGHPAGETEEMFWTGPFRSLCASCHSGTKALEERGKREKGCNVDGWPLAPMV